MKGRYRQRPGASSDEDRRIARGFQIDDETTPAELPSYVVADLPSYWPIGSLVYVSDASGGPLLAFFDGTNWKQANSPATTVT